VTEESREALVAHLQKVYDEFPSGIRLYVFSFPTFFFSAILQPSQMLYAN